MFHCSSFDMPLYVRVCVCVCVCVYVLVCVRACTVTDIFLLLLYLLVVTNSQMCMSDRIRRNCHWTKTATVSRVVQNQAPQPW